MNYIFSLSMIKVVDQHLEIFGDKTFVIDETGRHLVLK